MTVLTLSNIVAAQGQKTGGDNPIAIQIDTVVHESDYNNDRVSNCFTRGQYLRLKVYPISLIAESIA